MNSSFTRFFFVKSDGRYYRIRFDEILYIEGCRNYIKIVTTSKSYMVLFSLKAIEKFLPSDLFTRIHKSFIVSLEKVYSFDSDFVFLDGRELPIGLQFKGEIEKAVMIAHESTLEKETESDYLVLNGRSI
jgi:DNA-binding LytR/AlgR family response regulator